MSMPLLPVLGELSPSLGPPIDGLQYLMQVRYESRRCEQTKSVVIQDEIAPENIERSLLAPDIITPQSQQMLPLKQWTEKWIEKFEKLREVVELKRNQFPKRKKRKVPNRNDTQSWKHLLFERNAAPTLAFISSCDHVTIRHLIERFPMWIANMETQISCSTSLWLFSLLACLDVPCPADTQAALLAIARQFGVWRNQLNTHSNNFEERLIHCNIFITILSGFFKQGILETR